MFKVSIRRIVGDSMTPYLNDNDLIAVWKSNKYKSGDIIGFKFDGQILIKRISRIKDNQYYVLGDNPDNSLDSRKFGWVSNNNIIFKLLFRI
jgi:phage repressor protein C with HTH and peptisase S24 domain